VGVDGKIIGCLKLARRGIEGGTRTPDAAGDIVTHDRGVAHVLPDLALFRQAVPARPGHLQLLRGLDRAPFALGHDAKKVVDADDLHDAGDARD
jgi:hypothetical protein